MAEISKEEFLKIYNEKFLPILSKLEPERIQILQKRNKVMGIIIPIVILVVLAIIIGFKIIDIQIYFAMILVGALLVMGVSEGIVYSIKKKLKNEVIPKVLAVYGNLYISPNKDAITLNEMTSTGLFPRASWKSTDDVIIGLDKGCNFVISESELQHSEGSGKSRRTVTDFKGLVVKIQMKKNFTGKTVVGAKDCVSKKHGFDKVELESVEFMKYRDVYSTDQIEARYILTTSFMEHLENLYDNFCNERSIAAQKTNNVVPKKQKLSKNKSSFAVSVGGFTISDGGINLSRGLVSASFCDGFVYLFIPTYENFFEVDINNTLLNPDNYYKIYNELDSILSVIEYLNLNSKTGL